MIELSELIRASESDDDVRVVCTDGQVIVGDIVSVDDEEESGLGEPGISVMTSDGAFIGIGFSEIKRFSILAGVKRESSIAVA